MSITEELRSLTKDPLLGYASQNQHIERLTAIADRIDAAHEEALGSKVTGVLLANEDGTEFLAIPASKMAERYVELPKDADGEYIHIGDVMDELDARCPGTPTTFTVADMFYQGNDRWHLRAYPATYDPKTCRHHHEDTWERIIEDACKRAVDGYPDETGVIATSDLIERCKALAAEGGDAK